MQILPFGPPTDPTHGPISLKFELDRRSVHINVPAKNENNAFNTFGVILLTNFDLRRGGHLTNPKYPPQIFFFGGYN